MAHILVAEDDDDIRELITFLLGRDQHTVREATNGQDALTLYLEDDSFDLLCLDHDMPLLSGTDVVRRVRSVDPEVPILLITTSVLPEQIREAFEAGITAHLAKPFDLTRLRQKVSTLLTAAQPDP